MSSKVLLTALRARSRTSSLQKRVIQPCPLLTIVNHQQLHTRRPENQAQQTASTSHKNDDDGTEGTDTISKAMESYMQRAKEHQEFMDKEEKEFVFGRRHLANMMGKDPETFTQQDINEAIRYLFPSGLFSHKARPMMKPPQEIYPKQKAAEFDISGRPHHPFFYTASPNYFYLMHEMVAKINKMNISGGGLILLDSSDDIALAGTTWITKADLEGRLMERLTDKMYQEWVSCMDKISRHPQKDKELEFIKGYRKSMGQQTKPDDLPPVTLEPDGKKSCYVPLCMRKSARGEVKVTLPGTGRFNINGGQGLEYFTRIQSREVAITPLQLCGWLGKVDVDAFLTGGTERTESPINEPGEAARAGCLRWGIATAIAALGADAERLRLAGLLVRDHRQRERQKCGRDGARAKWTWKKR